MSKTRLYLSLAALIGLWILAGRVGVWAFPLTWGLAQTFFQGPGSFSPGLLIILSPFGE